jgi:hypothetical protein
MFQYAYQVRKLPRVYLGIVLIRIAVVAFIMLPPSWLLLDGVLLLPG